MSDPVEDFLAHHGVPGMKWGKRSNKSKTLTKAKKQPKTPEELKKAKARRDFAISAGLGAAMVASMALGGIRTSNISAQQRHVREDFSDVMGLPVSSIKLSYNPTTNVWG